MKTLINFRSKNLIILFSVIIIGITLYFYSSLLFTILLPLVISTSITGPIIYLLLFKNNINGLLRISVCFIILILDLFFIYSFSPRLDEIQDLLFNNPSSYLSVILRPFINYQNTLNQMNSDIYFILSLVGFSLLIIVSVCLLDFIISYSVIKLFRYNIFRILKKYGFIILETKYTLVLKNSIESSEKLICDQCSTSCNYIIYFNRNFTKKEINKIELNHKKRYNQLFPEFRKFDGYSHNCKYVWERRLISADTYSFEDQSSELYSGEVYDLMKEKK